MKELPVAWRFPRPEPGAAAALGADAGVSDLVAQILLNRGIRDTAAARDFLAPSLGQLADPRETPGLAAAAERLRAAARGRERVLVYGDYDVDGISGTALLFRFLGLAGATVSAYIPNRLDEGYGLNEAAVRKIAGDGHALIVTVDHGTTAVAEIALARELGLDVVVVDHHLPAETLPPATALVNPWLSGSPGPHPCGVGVAFKLAWGVAMALSGSPRVADAHREFLTNALGLVALGTIADVMPLRSENRVLASFGLRMLARTDRPGLRALLDVTGIEARAPTVADVGYKLAPRLNAAGRLGRAELALELLLTDSAARGREIASILDAENRRRKEIENEILGRAREQIEERYPPGHRGGFALGDPSWHAGVIGIVAARIVDLYHRPAAVVAFEGNLGRGSCRTIPAVRLPDALRRCSDHLLTWGGHDAAAGFTIHPDHFEAFRTAFDAAVREILEDRDPVKQLRIDGEAPLSAIGPGLVREVGRLAPFGEGNPEPVFATRNVRVAGRPRRMGKSGDHLSFLASEGGAVHRAVGFSMGPLAERLERTKTGLDIAYVPRPDDWRNDGSIELLLKDVAFPGESDGGS